jgi:hypothetical protein
VLDFVNFTHTAACVYTQRYRLQYGLLGTEVGIAT